jgi:uncharacterized protein (TIGR00369 family)
MEERYDNCFVCGKDNPIGLKMVFDYEEENARAEFKLPAHFEGYDKIIHGGIVAAVLDEAMAKIILHHKIKAVTGSINISYKKPLRPERVYRVWGKILRIRKKIIETEAEISDGEYLYARATARFFSVEK